MRDRQPIGGVPQQEVIDATCSSAQVPTVVAIGPNITPDPIGFVNPTFHPGLTPVITNPIPAQPPIIVQPSAPGKTREKSVETKWEFFSSSRVVRSRLSTVRLLERMVCQSTDHSMQFLVFGNGLCTGSKRLLEILYM